MSRRGWNYDKHELWRMDYAATMRNATRKGIEKGRAEGKIDTARNMKAEGCKVALIVKVTGLSEEDIERL